MFSIPHFSLRNLVSGYECGRVFPPGVGPGSPSRNAANWLSSRVSRSVATAVWLTEDGVPRCSPLPCSNLVPFGRWRHAKGREHCRGEPVSARSGGYAQIRRERRAVQSSTDQGSAEPLSARIKARTGRFLREKLISDHGMSSSFEGRQGAANGQDSWRRLHQLKASTTMDPVFQFSLSMYDVWP